MPARSLALLGELWHPLGAEGGASPPGAVSPHCAWLGSQGRVAGQPRNSGTHLASIMPWESDLQLVPSHVPPEHVLAGAGARGLAPQPPFRPQLGLPWAWLSSGEGQVDAGGAQPSSHRASDPPGPSWSSPAVAPRALVQSRGHRFQHCPVSPHGRGPEGVSCSRTALPRPHWGRDSPPLAEAFQRLHPKAQLRAVVAFPLGVLGFGGAALGAPGPGWADPGAGAASNME